MSMRQKNIPQNRASFLNFGKDRIGICRGIDHHRLAAVKKTVAIGAEGAGIKIDDFHAYTSDFAELLFIISYLYKKVYAFCKKIQGVFCSKCAFLKKRSRKEGVEQNNGGSNAKGI